MIIVELLDNSMSIIDPNWKESSSICSCIPDTDNCRPFQASHIMCQCALSEIDSQRPLPSNPDNTHERCWSSRQSDEGVCSSAWNCQPSDRPDTSVYSYAHADAFSSLSNILNRQACCSSHIHFSPLAPVESDSKWSTEWVRSKTFRQLDFYSCNPCQTLTRSVWLHFRTECSCFANISSNTETADRLTAYLRDIHASQRLPWSLSKLALYFLVRP